MSKDTKRKVALAPAQHHRAVRPQKLSQRTVANARLSAYIHENLLRGNPSLLSGTACDAWQGRGAGEARRGVLYMAFLPLHICTISARKEVLTPHFWKYS